MELSSAFGTGAKELEVLDAGDGTYLVAHVPEKSGEYILKIQIDGFHIVGSPFVVRVAQSKRQPPSFFSSYSLTPPSNPLNSPKS